MPKKQAFRITWEDGNTTVTEMNATLEEARAYYIAEPFQFGDTDEHPGDKMVRAVTVEELHRFHVFGKYWKDLDTEATYSKHLDATDKKDAERLAWLDIQGMNHGLSATVRAYPEEEP